MIRGELVDFLFMSLALIGVGGLAGLLLARQFTLMKVVSISTISTGCVGAYFFHYRNCFPVHNL